MPGASWIAGSELSVSGCDFYICLLAFNSLATVAGFCNLGLLNEILATGIGGVCTVAPVVYLVAQAALCLVELYIAADDDAQSLCGCRLDFPTARG